MKALFPVVILAGGLATRLRPITEKIPKALIEIHGEPFISHQLRLLQKQGVSEVVICAGYLGEQIQDWVGDGSQYHLSVNYSFDGEKLLGTAGAIKKAFPLLSDQFFVLYGDSYLQVNYKNIQDFFSQHEKSGLMTVLKNQNCWDKSNVEYGDGYIIQYDKQNISPEMQHIDYGLGIFKKEAFLQMTAEENYDLATLYQYLLNKNQLMGYEVFQRFYEIGSFTGIEELTNYLKE